MRRGTEQVAKVVADCRAGRLGRLAGVEAPHVEAEQLDVYGRKVCAEHEGPVIDATAIHDSIPYGKKFNLYTFGCVRPPWPKGRFYVPQHARGSAEHGVREQEFTLEPSEELTGG